MIPAVAQTLANLLARGISCIGTEHIDFNHPSVHHDSRPVLSLYCYNIQHNLQENAWVDSTQEQRIGEKELRDRELRELNESNGWFDVSFLLIAWDHTSLGEQQILSEALLLLLRHRYLPDEMLTPTLQGYEAIPLRVSAGRSSNVPALWKALGVPLRPALYITVTVPFHRALLSEGINFWERQT